MNNAAILTAGNAVYTRKRALKKSRIEELAFDPEQRRDYLTGFRKRKAQRQKRAAEYAKEQARKQRIEARKELRDSRKADIEKRLQSVNEQRELSAQNFLLRIGIDTEDGEEDDGIGTPELKSPEDSIWMSHFDEEEKTTTVTITDDFVAGGIEAADRIRPAPSENSAETRSSTLSKPVTVPPEPQNVKTKKKAFRYGTKAERQSDRKKAKLKKRTKHRK